MNVKLKPATESDQPFFKEVFSQIKLNELQIPNADASIMTPIIDMQYFAQQNSYITQFPEMEAFLITSENSAVGKLLVSKTSCYHIIDISLHKTYQNKGIGTIIIKSLLKEAHAANKHVELSVAQNNPARNLYKRLGFKTICEDEVYLKMKAENK